MLHAVAESVFPYLDPARAVLRGIDATLALAPEPTPEAIVLGRAGFGRIPQLVAPKAKAFGMRVVAFDPYVSAELFARAGVERVDFADLLSVSDYISIPTPLVPETHGLFDAEAFRCMKPTAYIINTARGAIVEDRKSTRLN